MTLSSQGKESPGKAGRFSGPVSYTYGNGLSRNLYYDQNLNPGDMRLTGLTTMDGGTTLQSLLMGYNSNELITSITNFANLNLNQSYSYDTLSRLSGMTSPAGNETIQYDATGNRTMHNWLAPIANDVDPASNRILRDYVVNGSGINYTHDARGNRASQSWNGSTATYSYGAFNQLASVSRTAPTTYHNNAYALMTYPAGTTTYTVNALDQRIAKSNSTTTARYVYTGQNQLVAENNNGQWTSHIWIGGEPVGFIRGGAMHWTHTDHLRRPELVTNAAKQVVWRARNFHSERGVTLDSVGGYNLGFPGQYFDAETGLWYNGFRYYDSRLGRYTQSDPIGLAAGLNTYSYVKGNPVGRIDPNGLDDVSLVLYGSGVIDKMPNRQATDCELEAAADLAVNLTEFGAIVQFGLDLAGVEVNTFDNPGIHFGVYNEATAPAALVGHSAAAGARYYERHASNVAQRAGEAGIHYSVRNGRMNRSRMSGLKATALRRGASVLGPVGAFSQYGIDLNKCRCRK